VAEVVQVPDKGVRVLGGGGACGVLRPSDGVEVGG
jgi:hypothetical protein